MISNLVKPASPPAWCDVSNNCVINESKTKNQEIETKKKNLEADLASQDTLSKINKSELAIQKAEKDLEIEIAQKFLKQKLEEMQAEVNAVTEKATAVSPDLIAALQTFSDRALAEKMAETMAPLAILGGKSIADVFSQLLKGTSLEDAIKLHGTGLTGLTDLE